MMYVVLVGFVSQQCNDPEMKPITHEKGKQGKCTGRGSVAQLDLETGGVFTEIRGILKVCSG